jgi:hypothetical protein
MKHLHLRQFDLNLLKAMDALLAERNVTRALNPAISSDSPSQGSPES